MIITIIEIAAVVVTVCVECFVVPIHSLRVGWRNMMYVCTGPALYHGKYNIMVRR